MSVCAKCNNLGNHLEGTKCRENCGRWYHYKCVDTPDFFKRDSKLSTIEIKCPFSCCNIKCKSTTEGRTVKETLSIRQPCASQTNNRKRWDLLKAQNSSMSVKTVGGTVKDWRSKKSKISRPLKQTTQSKDVSSKTLKDWKKSVEKTVKIKPLRPTVHTTNIPNKRAVNPECYFQYDTPSIFSSKKNTKDVVSNSSSELVKDALSVVVIGTDEDIYTKMPTLIEIQLDENKADVVTYKDKSIYCSDKQEIIEEPGKDLKEPKNILIFVSDKAKNLNKGKNITSEEGLQKDSVEMNETIKDIPSSVEQPFWAGNFCRPEHTQNFSNVLKKLNHYSDCSQTYFNPNYHFLAKPNGIPFQICSSPRLRQKLSNVRIPSCGKQPSDECLLDKQSHKKKIKPTIPKNHSSTEQDAEENNKNVSDKGKSEENEENVENSIEGKTEVSDPNDLKKREKTKISFNQKHLKSSKRKSKDLNNDNNVNSEKKGIMKKQILQTNQSNTPSKETMDANKDIDKKCIPQIEKDNDDHPIKDIPETNINLSSNMNEKSYTPQNGNKLNNLISCLSSDAIKLKHTEILEHNTKKSHESVKTLESVLSTKEECLLFSITNFKEVLTVKSKESVKSNNEMECLEKYDHTNSDKSGMNSHSKVVIDSLYEKYLDCTHATIADNEPKKVEDNTKLPAADSINKDIDISGTKSHGKQSTEEENTKINNKKDRFYKQYCPNCLLKCKNIDEKKLAPKYENGDMEKPVKIETKDDHAKIESLINDETSKEKDLMQLHIDEARKQSHNRQESDTYYRDNDFKPTNLLSKRNERVNYYDDINSNCMNENIQKTEKALTQTYKHKYNCQNDAVNNVELQKQKCMKYNDSYYRDKETKDILQHIQKENDRKDMASLLLRIRKLPDHDSLKNENTSDGKSNLKRSLHDEGCMYSKLPSKESTINRSIPERCSCKESKTNPQLINQRKPITPVWSAYPHDPYLQTRLHSATKSIELLKKSLYDAKRDCESVMEYRNMMSKCLCNIDMLSIAVNQLTLKIENMQQICHQNEEIAQKPEKLKKKSETLIESLYFSVNLCHDEEYDASDFEDSTPTTSLIVKHSFDISNKQMEKNDSSTNTYKTKIKYSTKDSSTLAGTSNLHLVSLPYDNKFICIAESINTPFLPEEATYIDSSRIDVHEKAINCIIGCENEKGTETSNVQVRNEATFTERSEATELGNDFNNKPATVNTSESKHFLKIQCTKSTETLRKSQDANLNKDTNIGVNCSIGSENEKAVDAKFVDLKDQITFIERSEGIGTTDAVDFTYQCASYNERIYAPEHKTRMATGTKLSTGQLDEWDNNTYLRSCMKHSNIYWNLEATTVNRFSEFKDSDDTSLTSEELSYPSTSNGSQVYNSKKPSAYLNLMKKKFQDHDFDCFTPVKTLSFEKYSAENLNNLISDKKSVSEISSSKGGRMSSKIQSESLDTRKDVFKPIPAIKKINKFSKRAHFLFKDNNRKDPSCSQIENYKSDIAKDIVVDNLIDDFLGKRIQRWSIWKKRHRVSYKLSSPSKRKRFGFEPIKEVGAEYVTNEEFEVSDDLINEIYSKNASQHNTQPINKSKVTFNNTVDLVKDTLDDDAEEHQNDIFDETAGISSKDHKRLMSENENNETCLTTRSLITRGYGPHDFLSRQDSRNIGKRPKSSISYSKHIVWPVMTSLSESHLSCGVQNKILEHPSKQEEVFVKCDPGGQAMRMTISVKGKPTVVIEM